MLTTGRLPEHEPHAKSRQNAPRTVIFLGAGASAADGAPLQQTLFREYFRRLSDSERAYEYQTPVERDFRSRIPYSLYRLFTTTFPLDAKDEDAEFPTFEEVLGVLDLALLRSESMPQFQTEDGWIRTDYIQELRDHVIFAMSTAIARATSDADGTNHRMLLRNLMDSALGHRIAFITTNYDLILDNAIRSLTTNSVTGRVQHVGSYSADMARPSGRITANIPLLKIHGSLNWEFCPSCGRLQFAEEGKARGDTSTGLVPMRRPVCKRCSSFVEILVIPPTYFKNLGNPVIANVWNDADAVLQAASLVVFCGYSFPDADMHVKYLLKRAQMVQSARGGEGTQVRYLLVNNHQGKTSEQSISELRRYMRFLGSNCVTDSRLSFQEFASDPLRCIRSQDTQAALHES